MVSDEEGPRGDEPDSPQADEDWKAQVEAEKTTADEETPGETEAAQGAVDEAQTSFDEANAALVAKGGLKKRLHADKASQDDLVYMGC